MYDSYVKIGNTVIEHKFIEMGTYSCTPNHRIDRDSERLATGVLDRTVLPHMPSSIEWQTPGIMWESQKREFMKIIRDNWLDKAERKVRVEFWDDENDELKQEDMYLADIKWSEKGSVNGEKIYGPTTINLTGY